MTAINIMSEKGRFEYNEPRFSIIMFFLTNTNEGRLVDDDGDNGGFGDGNDAIIMMVTAMLILP